MAVNRATVEGIVLLGSGLIGLADGLRLVFFKNPASVEDFTGPGRYLFVVSLLLTVLGASYLLVMRRAPEPERGAGSIDWASDRELVAVVAVLAVYIFLIDIVGYFWSTQVFFLLILRVLGIKFSVRMIAVGATMGAVFYLLFVQLFGMTFPHGMLFS